MDVSERHKTMEYVRLLAFHVRDIKFFPPLFNGFVWISILPPRGSSSGGGFNWMILWMFYDHYDYECFHSQVRSWPCALPFTDYDYDSSNINFNKIESNLCLRSENGSRRKEGRMKVLWILDLLHNGSIIKIYFIPTSCKCSTSFLLFP